MSDQIVPDVIDGPDRELSLNAVAKALLKVRSREGMTCARLGKILDCCADTIKTASNEESMLCFVSVARLVRFFPEEAAPITDLMLGRPTRADRFRRIRADLAELEREAR